MNVDIVLVSANAHIRFMSMSLFTSEFCPAYVSGQISMTIFVVSTDNFQRLNCYMNIAPSTLIFLSIENFQSYFHCLQTIFSLMIQKTAVMDNFQHI